MTPRENSAVNLFTGLSSDSKRSRYILNRQLNSPKCLAGLDPASPCHTEIHVFERVEMICVFYCRINIMISGMRTGLITAGWVCVFLLVLFPVFSMDAAAHAEKKQAVVVSDVTIRITGAFDNQREYQQMAKDVIFLKPGHMFSEKALKDSMNALTLTRRFEHIHVDSKESDHQLELIFTLTPARFIKTIKLKGNYPFFEKEILNILNIYVGDKYDASILVQQINLIADFFKNKGFYTPGVYIDALQDRNDGNYIVNIKIVKGPYFKLNHITIDGNHAFSAILLKMKIKQFRYSFFPGMTNRFIDWEFKKEIKDLTSFYNKKGYPDAEIFYEVDQNRETHEVDIRITINEGEKYEVSFKGNNAFSKRKLKKDIALFERRSNVSFGTRRTIRNIKNTYLDAGYPDTVVRMTEDNDPEENTRYLTFLIQEGPRTLVDDIIITGNDHLRTRKIKRQMLTAKPGPFKIIRKGNYISGTLSEDIIAIQTLYRNNGFPDAKIQSSVTLNEAKTRAKISIDIAEGQKMLVSSVVIKGLSAVPLDQAIQAIHLKQDRIFRESMITEDENILSALISEQGYPYVTVKGKFQIKNDEVEVEYRVDEGIYVTMGQVYCTGNFQTRSRILKNEVNIEPEAPFSLSKILEGQRNIQNMAIFNGVRFKYIGLKEQQDTINLFIEVEENKSRYIQFGSGYNSEKGVFGSASIGDHNLFGTNKDTYILYERSQVGRLLESGILEPRFFGTHIEADLILKDERKEEYNKDYGTETSSATLGLRRKLLKNITVGISTGVKQTREYPITETSDTEDTETDVWTITPSLIYDSRDSFVRPRKGILSIFSVDISTDEFNIYEEDKDSDYDFMKYSADFRFYFTPYDRYTFAVRSMAGYIFPYNSENWASDDALFYLGGMNTVRGFRENELAFDDNGDAQGGMIMALGSIEARIDLGANFELALFVDTGEIDNTEASMGHHYNLDYLRTSAGLGFRYHTLIGPVGVFYGKNLDPRPGEDSGQFHFALGYTF